MGTNERSQRTPGYKYRPVDAADMEDRAKLDAHAFDVHADGGDGTAESGVTPKDTKKAQKRS